ncbi:MAG: hypothetical protein N3D16_05420, partial [Anaerolineales bacterium]|nr:hypothetical protein [Anaerolineales bacterium]
LENQPTQQGAQKAPSPLARKSTSPSTVVGKNPSEPALYDEGLDWDLTDELIPLPEDDLPPWEDEPQAVLANPAKAAPVAEVNPGVALKNQEPQKERMRSTEEAAEVRETQTPYILPPDLGREAQEIQMLTIVFRQGEDRSRDLFRFRRIYGTLVSYPGNDRFCFQVFDNGRGYLIQFPNETTGVCPELLQRLQDLVGPENYRIEKLPTR